MDARRRVLESPELVTYIMSVAPGIPTLVAMRRTCRQWACLGGHVAVWRAHGHVGMAEQQAAVRGADGYVLEGPEDCEACFTAATYLRMLYCERCEQGWLTCAPCITSHGAVCFECWLEAPDGCRYRGMAWEREAAGEEPRAPWE